MINTIAYGLTIGAILYIISIGLSLTFGALAGSAWLVLGYVVPWTAVLGPQPRPVVATANGTWFIWTVASQSVATAAATLEPHAGDGRNALALIAVVAWSS